jgi:hypothetical protein
LQADDLPRLEARCDDLRQSLDSKRG